MGRNVSIYFNEAASQSQVSDRFALVKMARTAHNSGRFTNAPCIR